MTSLDRSAFTTYLNDHLAGSIVALELMDRLCTAHFDNRLGETMTDLKRDIDEEQSILKELVEGAGGTESNLAKSIAWIGEKVTRLKIGPGTDDRSGLMLFEALEALSIGFWGRRSLWRALDHLGLAASLRPGTDFAALARRAEQHLDALEPLRLEASVLALTEAVSP